MSQMSHLGPTLRRQRRRERPGLRTVLALGISLLANWLLMTRIDPARLGLGPVKAVRPVDLAALSAADWKANRAIRDPNAVPAPQVAPAPPVPPPVKDTGKPGTVVKTAGANTAPPKETDYASERDNTVEKETRSRYVGPGVPGAPAGPVAKHQADGLPQGGQEGKSDRFVEGRAGAPSGQDRREARNRGTSRREGPPPIAGGEIPTLPWEPKAAPEPSRTGDATAGGEGGQRRPGLNDPRLALSPQTLARLAGGGSTDYIDGVEDGDRTFLNTREFKYATYYNRIQEAVSTSWDPSRALDLRDPDRSIFGTRDRITLLTVTLDKTGALKDVVVRKSSGLEFLDRTTIEAVKKAQPFANPPAGILDPNGDIRFNYGFYVEYGRGFQVFRGGP